MCNYKQRLSSLLIVLLLFTILVGGINVDSSYAKSKKIQLFYKNLTMSVGETDYQALLINKNVEISSSKIKWKSYKPSIATINKKGKIRAKKIGTTKMTAKHKGKTYKFTVKVTSPFKSGESPRSFRINDYYKTLGYYYLHWDGLIAADEYQIYISRNGNEYELYTTTEEFYCYVKDIDDEGHYSFKVRGKCGKYYSSFSIEQTVEVKVDKPCSVSISQNLPFYFSNGDVQMTIDKLSVKPEISTWSASPRQYIGIRGSGSFSGIDYNNFRDSMENLKLYLYDDNNNLIHSEKVHFAIVSYNGTFTISNGIYLHLSNNGHFNLVIGN